ncbi:hypothetical protein E2C01_088597 [Portunus trituberculatus]|uniref:Uncharacterized protein n=1 Tax=Portunus trituberculatus TaxID=210409 RepID=A0A5B7JF34_PORTR|nr:hypothetical protein [Portunus trituberculatus]
MENRAIRLEKGVEGNPNQQRCVPQKDSQSRKLLWEALVKRNPPPYSDLKITSCRPGQPPHENLIVFCV